MMNILQAQSFRMCAVSRFICVVLVFTQGGVFNQVHGLQLITQPNRLIVAFTGSNQTFSWNLSLTDKEKTKELKIQFGLWDKEKDHVKGNYLIWLVREPSGKESVNKGKGNEPITKRLHWAGDLARGYFVAFQFSNVQQQDSGDYGIRFRVDGFPPDILQDSFTFIVQDPPLLPTKPPKPQNITLKVEEGHQLNITCRSRMESSSSVLWLRDNQPIRTGHNRFLFIKSISRSQAGNYICVSLSPNGYHSSPITTVDVLYPPKIIHIHNKQVSLELLRGNSTTLKCTASANPVPKFTWRKQEREISRRSYKNTWNSSALIVTPVNDGDFTSYVCIVKNQIGLDSVTFTLKEKADEPTRESKTTTGTQSADQPRMTAQERSNLWTYVGVGIAVVAVIMVLAYVCCRRRWRGNNCGRSPKRDGVESVPLSSLDKANDTTAK